MLDGELASDIEIKEAERSGQLTTFLCINCDNVTGRWRPGSSQVPSERMEPLVTVSWSLPELEKEFRFEGKGTEELRS